MKVVVVGTRGIPDIQGGVETHCSGLYPELVALGVDVTVIRRRNYADALDSARGLTEWKGVKLLDIYAPKRKSMEAIVHTFLAVLKARTLNPDMVHIHAVGPSLMVPVARMLGLKVVMTNHGPDYNRSKWGKLARFCLKLGERVGSKFSNRIIAISPLISAGIKSDYNRTAAIIPNGVPNPEVPENAEGIIGRYGLTPRHYIVALGRFVPEKGFDTLIKAFSILRASNRIAPDIKLVIAGDADHETEYSRALRTQAEATPGTVLTGFISGDTLKAITALAGVFAMPSTHEGLPIALLEAMSYDLDVATSDIPACRLPELEASDSVPPCDPEALANLLASKLAHLTFPRHYDMTRYSWPEIAKDTLAVYTSLSHK